MKNKVYFDNIIINIAQEYLDSFVMPQVLKGDAATYKKNKHTPEYTCP